MSKIKDMFSKRKIKLSKEVLAALENAQLPEDIIEQIINIILLQRETRKAAAKSKEIIYDGRTNVTPEEMLGNTYNRLDELIERTENMKSRVASINVELQELAYYG
jgi:hypothetical protein